MKYSRYKKESNYTYAYGAFASFEALTHALSHVKAILLHEKLKYTEDINKLLKIARSNNIEIIVSSKDVEVLAEKENTFVITVIEKYNFSKQFDNSHNQVVLVNPMNSGNLGTIMRAMIGFGVNNLAIITPSTDIFDPKVIRASQGSIFSLNIKAYDSWEKYEQENNIHKYFFVLAKNSYLQDMNNKIIPSALIFGNESTGLPKNIYENKDTVTIKHSSNIDSLNVSISVAIALYEFYK